MTQKKPSWIQSSDEVWGEAVSSDSDHSDWLRSLDAPELPTSALEPLPDHDAPLRPAWIVEHVADMVEDKRRRVIGPHGLTFAMHTDMQMAVANLDAARRAATGDLRDQLARQHREAKQELDDFQRSDGFQKALRHYLEAAGPAFERIASATPENQAAAVYQQREAARYEGLKALAKPESQIGNGAATEQGRPRQGLLRQQEQEILTVLRKLGYDPKGLPKRKAGKPGVKATVRANLPHMTESVFKKAWERLRDFDDIVGAN